MSTRNQIINKAQELFITNGYDATSVQNIIDTVGIAKGTFYYHFESKEALLEEITIMVSKNEADKMSEKLQAVDGNAITKLNAFFDMQSKWKSTKFDLLYLAIKVLYTDQNVLYLKKIKEMNVKYYLPIFSSIIIQGVNEGVFDTPYPNSVGEVIIRISNDFSNQLAHVLIHHKQYEDPTQYIKEKFELILHCIERLIGVKNNVKLNRMDMQAIESFIDYLEERDGKK